MTSTVEPQKPHSSALRKGRVSESGRIYHVRFTTHQRRPLFEDLYLARIIVNSLRAIHERGDVESLAWVVMPDHVHWLFALQRQHTLSAVMHSVKGFTASCINAQRSVSAQHVWQSGYFDRALRRDDDVMAVARYIVANPLRAGLCGKLGDYPHWDAAWL